MQAEQIRKYRPFVFPPRRGDGRFHVGPLDCCKLGELDICCDAVFCPCCLMAKVKHNVDFAKTNSRLYEETSSSSSDDDENDVNENNARVLSRYEQRYSDRSYCDCETFIQAGVACLPLPFFSMIFMLPFIEDINNSFRAAPFFEERRKQQRTPFQSCSICCGEQNSPKSCKTGDSLLQLACGFTLAGPTFTPLFGSFYARELRHRQLYDGGCISAATPQVPNRNWLRRRQSQLIKVHGQTRMKLALDIFRVAWFVSRFLPKCKNRFDFFDDDNLKIPQMV